MARGLRFAYVLVNINELTDCRVLGRGFHNSLKATQLKNANMPAADSGNEIDWVIIAWDSLDEWVINLLNWI